MADRVSAGLPAGLPEERERRFLVKAAPLALALTRAPEWTVAELVQGYLSLDPARVVRVRRCQPATHGDFLACLAGGEPAESDHGTADARAWLGIKGSSRLEDNALVRPEWELPLDPDTARQLLDTLALPPVIHKLRAELPAGIPGLLWQLDLFLGRNRGLVIAEIELPAGVLPPAPPPWLGREITAEGAYSNAALVLRPFDAWPERA